MRTMIGGLGWVTSLVKHCCGASYGVFSKIGTSFASTAVMGTAQLFVGFSGFKPEWQFKLLVTDSQPCLAGTGASRKIARDLVHMQAQNLSGRFSLQTIADVLREEQLV